MTSISPLTSLISTIAPSMSFARLSTRTQAVLALIGANAIWGTSAVATKALLPHVPPLTLACLRVAIALAVLLPLVTRNGGRPSHGSGAAFLGLTGVALFCLMQNVGLRYASAANTALINGGIPMLTALLAAALLGERLTRQQLAGLLISLGGVAGVVILGTGDTLGGSGLGNMLPFAGATCFATYVVVGRRIFTSDNALAVVAGSTRYGLMFLLPGAGLELATVGGGTLTISDLLLLLYLGAGCSAMAFVLCGYGLARLDAGRGAAFGNLKPFVGVILAVVLLGEPLNFGHFSGGALVLLGVLLASRRTPTGDNGVEQRQSAAPREGSASAVASASARATIETRGTTFQKNWSALDQSSRSRRACELPVIARWRSTRDRNLSVCVEPITGSRSTDSPLILLGSSPSRS